MNEIKPLTELTVAELWKEVKVTEEEIWGDLKLEAQIFLKRILEGAMEDEVMEYIGISRKYERTSNRTTQRNGYYERDLETELGLVSELEVPRTRDGGYRTKVFKRYQRRQNSVNESIKDMFLAGISTRRVGEVLKPLIGTKALVKNFVYESMKKFWELLYKELLERGIIYVPPWSEIFLFYIH
jgi:transposase-like protein